MTRVHLIDELEARAALARQMTGMTDQIIALANRFIVTLRGGGTLFFAGTGGSAADAQHIATEYVVRYRKNRRPMAAAALTTDTSLLTAAGNDLGFEELFARQVEAFCRKRDGDIIKKIKKEKIKPAIIDSDYNGYILRLKRLT